MTSNIASACPGRSLISSGIRAIAFDAVGTIIYPRPSVSDVYCSVIERHTGSPPDRSMVSQAVGIALASRTASRDQSTSENEERSFWFELIRSLVHDSDQLAICFDELFEHFAVPDHWCCFPDVDQVMKALSARGFSLAIASNFDHRLHSVCRGLPPLQIVPHRIVSSEVGWRKPAAQFFDALATALECRKDELLVVGDDLVNDVEGALAAGCQAIWINRSCETPPTDVPVISSLEMLLA